ncbi:hypothetical protein BDV93DRAFT_553066 [Ceratobasidium sp. AG-I]|nr:hypothetical protein BDV93DRAFT_553066 [Ceratobasidium sp. AG-I]
MHTLSFVSALLAVSAAVAEHGVGVTRTSGHANNAERFARGLPPLPPANLKQPTKMARALAPRASPGLCTSTQTITGLIEVTGRFNGFSYGYVTTDYDTGYSTIDPTKNLRTVSITLPCNPTSSDLSSVNIASGTSDHPYWGAILSYSSTNNDMTTTNYSYAQMGTTDLTGKVPTLTGNSPRDQLGAGKPSESPVWTYDVVTGGLTMSWYNADGRSGVTTPFKIGSTLYATENVSEVAKRFNIPYVYPLNYRLVQTTTVFH